MNLSFPVDTGGLRGTALDSFWKRHFQAPFVPSTHSLDHRLMCAWRLVRYHALLKGFVSEDEWLSEGLGLPVLEDASPTGGSLWDWPAQAEKQLPWQFRYLDEIPLTPASEDSPAEVRRKFDAERFCEAYYELAVDIGIDRGSDMFPDYGQIGIAMLRNPIAIHQQFPSRNLIIEFEERLARQASEVLLQTSFSNFTKTVTNRFGLTQGETRSLKRLGLRLASSDNTAEIEERRAVMSGRLENLVERARESLDLKAELGALKIMTLIQGLSATKPEDEVADFVRVVANASKEGSRAMSASLKNAVNPGRTRIEVDDADEEEVD